MASRNRKKLAELRRVLDAAGVSGLTLLSLDDVAAFDEAPETGATFEENALAKARDAYQATGLASVADDSGLEVDALNGMPGVLSARWSGRHGDDSANTSLLLAQMGDVPDERRGAAFVSACALVYRAGDARKRPWCAGSGRAASCGSRVGTADSAMTRCSCLRVRADCGGAQPGGEGCGVASRAGVSGVVADVAGFGCSKLSLYARFHRKFEHKLRFDGG